MNLVGALVTLPHLGFKEQEAMFAKLKDRRGIPEGAMLGVNASQELKYTSSCDPEKHSYCGSLCCPISKTQQMKQLEA